MSDPTYISHFSHSHGYFFSNTSDIQKSIHCEACGDEISTSNGPLYASCDRCKKFMHKICTELPREIRNHPFHKHHPLTLLIPPPDKLDGATCHACGDTIRNFRYRCRSELCDFDLDLKCSTLIHMTASDVVREHQLCNQQIPHPHPLIFCCRKDPSFEFYCGACGLPFVKKGDRAFIYVCLECRLLLHSSCADLPPEITNHPFHPHHCLSIHQKHEFSCSACNSSWNALSFQCSQNCDFQLDILCATLISKGAISTTKYHKHPLIDCYVDQQQVNKFHSPCPACNQPFKDSLSFCSDCRILAHKSCVELPFRITHPFHSHQLQLSSSLIELKCHACLQSKHGLSYKCVSLNCGYRSCLRCTFMGYSVIKDCSSHLNSNHLLYSFEFQPIGSRFDCDRCGHQIFTPFFRCIQCNFNLHFHCLSRLPPAVTHNNHRHNLTLTYLPIKDHPDEDENAELYCDSCEERRDLLHPSYYCAECHYVTHVHCVRMQVRTY